MRTAAWRRGKTTDSLLGAAMLAPFIGVHGSVVHAVDFEAVARGVAGAVAADGR